jgi:hypothetical protein
MRWDKCDVVNSRFFHKRAFIQENCKNKLLEIFACSQNQDVSACGIETQ